MMLLAAAATPDFSIINKDQRTLFTEFIRSMSDSESSLKFLERLLSDGADLNFCAQYYGKPKSGLDYLAEKKAGILKFALDNSSIDINEQDNEGNTLLHKVCLFM